MKSKNVADHLGRLHVLFTVAMSEGLLDSIPSTTFGPAIPLPSPRAGRASQPIMCAPSSKPSKASQSTLRGSCAS